MIKLTFAQIDTITGSVLGLESVSEELGVDGDEIEDALLEWGIERCPGCDWYRECIELVDENGDPQLCDDCRRYDEHALAE